jgi:hypothetical protein
VKLDEAPAAEAGDTSLRFLLEEHGQDAAVHQGATFQLVQFKYSQNARPIEPAELAAILLALDNASKLVPQEHAIRWQLVTNRQLSPTAQRLYDSAGRPKRGGALRTSRASNDKVITRLGARLAFVHRDLDEMRLELLDAARRFGADDGAVERVFDLMVKVAARAPHRRLISRAAMDEALAGYRNPRSVRLDDGDCRDHLRERLASAVRAQGGISLAEAVERRSLRSLFAEPAALAIVHGPGGCGKTISLFKALDGRLAQAVGLSGMVVAPPRSLSHIYDSWRNAKPAGLPGAVLPQLRLANPNLKRPVLVLGLDGWDELSDSERTEAASLVQYFHAMHVDWHVSRTEPDGLLVVTCRNKEDITYVVGPRGTGGMHLEIPAFDVGEFEDAEIAEVWAQWFPDEEVPYLGVLDEMRVTYADEGDRVGVVRDPFLVALRHPVLLGCTKTLSAEQRQQLYRGDATVRRQVLSTYVDWFTRKSVDRAGCSPRRVLGILKAAARATVGTQTVGTCDRDEHWVRPATAETGEAPGLAKQIFEDAVTAGVVVTGVGRYSPPVTMPVTWRWRFHDLAAHLASLA